MQNLRKVKPAVAVKFDENEDFDEMPFMSQRNVNRSKVDESNFSTQQLKKVVNNDEEEKERDWLLDPMNLYMKGMAHRRAQMRQIHTQIGQEQREEVDK